MLLVDGMGAMISAVSLGVVLPLVQNSVGVPTDILLFLSVLAVILACCSSLAYLFAGKWWNQALRMVACANLCYCFLTAGLLWFYSDEVKILGLIYFGCELFLVVGLAVWELRVADQK